MSWYRLRGFLILFGIFACFIIFVPDAIQRQFGWWIVGAMFGANLWWFAKSGPREWHEREQREAERRTR
ncbi:MAG: hypothetical protein R3C30_16605 [Hyphomonadaceae bacterium]